jgi:hypothetical protein
MPIKISNPPIIPPIMTTAQRTGMTAVEGAFVYDLTLHKLYIYTGAAWELITSL